MCGRSRVTLNRQQVAAAARTAPERWRNADSFQPSYNLTPGHDAPVVLCDAQGEREVQTMRWGLVPSWTKKGTQPDHFRMFNARSETVGEKSVFSRLLSSKRCIFLCEGFYEWKKDGSKKQPFYIHLGEDRVMHMAALYDVWHTGEGDQTLATFTILTTDSSTRLRWLHDRMPVLLMSTEAQDAWLGETVDFKTLNQLVTPYNGEDLVWHEVTPQMGKPAFQGPECCKPLKKGPGIAAFFKKPAPGGKPAAAGDGKPCGAADSKPAAASAGKGVAELDRKAANSGAAQQLDSAQAQTGAQVKVEQRDGQNGAAAADTDVKAELDLKAEDREAARQAASAAADPAAERQPGSAEVKAEDEATPALPLNPDDSAAEVEQEEQQQQGSQPGSQASSPPNSQPGTQPEAAAGAAPKAGQKRSAANASPAGKSPGGKRPKKEAVTPDKGQKTMQAFFGAAK